MPYGVPTVYPETPGIPPYHNRSVWPFVQAFWNLAAARDDDEALLLYGLASIERESAMFLTNKENFVSNSGSPQGTAINSDRQLWSVAGNLAMVYHVLFGMRFEPSGLYFHPVVPFVLADTRTLSNFSYRHAKFSIEVRGFGAHVRRFTLDGKQHAPVVPVSIRGQHRIVIELDDHQAESTPMHNMNNTIAPDTPRVQRETESLTWNIIPGATSYQIFANGARVQTTQQTQITLPEESRLTEYQVAALTDDKQVSFLSEPLVVGDAAMRIPSPTIVDASSDPAGYIELDQQHPNLILNATVPKDGDYSLAFLYANGSGPINTDNKCAIRTLFVDGSEIGPIVLPQRGTGLWDDWGLSNHIALSLAAGRHRFELRFLPFDTNMNRGINQARVAAMQLQRVGPWKSPNTAPEAETRSVNGTVAQQ
jgi:hypothetical protein